ncbi:MAG: hypothetical protein ACRDRP_14150 [Pseudonocardiaceae bacterium]
MSLDVASAPRDAAATVGRPQRMLQAGSTTPERLRRVAAGLVVGCLVTAVVSFLGGLSRTDAVRDSGTRIAALTADAAELYRSLADADATVTSGYVSGGLEPAPVRARYDADIARAADLVVRAAGRLPAGDPAAVPVAAIGVQLPVYTGLVETARAHNRQCLPLGQSYLDSASRLMRATILPAAENLRQLQTAALAAAYQRGGAIPFAIVLIGAAVLAGVVDHAVLERRRTNRVVNTGLLAAGAALVAALLWWVVAVAVAGDRLDGARRHGAAATALDRARIAVLQARSNESLVLVARGGGGSSEQGFTTQVERVLGDGGLLADAERNAPDSAVRIEAVRTALVSWRDAHRRVRELDDGGQYRPAVDSVTGADPAGSGAAFGRLDAALANAIDVERRAFTVEVGRADSALTGLTAGPAVLALLAAGAVTAGIGWRVGEYR